MRTKLAEISIIAIVLLFLGLCFAGWDNDKPADSDQWNDAPGYIRENWDALETLLGVDLDATTIRFDVNDVNAVDITTKSPWFDVRAYGADPTGVADSTTEIQEALDAANTAGGGIVFVPDGTYKTTSELTVYSDTIVRGVGEESKITLSTTRANIIKTDSSANDILIEDLWIYGSGTTNTNEIGVLVDDSNDVTIRRCKFENMTIGVHFEASSGGLVFDCFFKDIVGAAGVTEGYGVLASSANDHIKTIGCRFDTIARHAIYYGATITDSIMANNNVDGTGEAALCLNTLESQTVSKNNIITGNTVKNVTSNGNDGYGIVLNTHHFNTIITNNTLESISDIGILVISANNGTVESKMVHRVLISTNSISTVSGGATTIGIKIYNAQDFQIVSNNIYSADYGIWVGVSGTSNMSYVKNGTIAHNQIHTIATDGIYMGGGSRMSNMILGPNLLTTITGTDIVESSGMAGLQNHLGLIWHEDVMAYTDFSAGSATPTHNFTITLPAGCILTDVYWKLDTEFAGGSVSAATLELGVNGVDDDGIFPAEDVFTGAGTGFKDTAIANRGVLIYNTKVYKYFCTATRTIKATLRLTGDTGDSLSAGQVRIWIGYYRVANLTT